MAIIRKYFFDSIKASLFRGFTQPQVDGLNRYLDYFDMENPDIPDKHHLDDRMFSYVLATVYHETGATMQPVREYGSESYLKSKDYYPYYGRGDVQLTWKDNYLKMGQKLGYEDAFVQNPDAVLEPQVSLKICVLGMLDGDFTGKRLADFITYQLTDWYDARTIVNGHDRATDIAGYAELFCNAITRA